MDSVSDNYEFDSSYPHPTEVEAEYKKATLMPEARAWLRAQGVPDAVMEGVIECTSGFVRDDDFNLHFKIDPEPELNRTIAVRTAFHVPVTANGQFVDLIRFTRENPRASHLMHGGRICHGVTWLGQPEPEAKDVSGWPVPTPIWRSPLAWLRAERRGLCYLRLSWPSSRLDLLRRLPAVIGENTDHALRLDKVVWQFPEHRRKRPRHWARIPDFREMVSHATRRATALVQS